VEGQDAFAMAGLPVLVSSSPRLLFSFTPLLLPSFTPSLFNPAGCIEAFNFCGPLEVTRPM
jgi:hypothetical protein